MKRIAVLLFNLGGPKNPEDVQGFLYNLFADKNIINLPFGVRQGVASLISSRRAPSAKKNYAHMGGGSPILKETEAQAQALEAYIAANTKGIEAKVFIGMRYWHPFIEDTVREIDAWGPDEIVLLPLYPQFSSTTTLSSFQAFQKVYAGKARVTSVCCYSDNAHFIKAHVDAIQEKIGTLKQPGHYRLLFSAHGLPESIIARGDPYQAQVESCVAKIMTGLGNPIEHSICYQSRVGPMKWIGPSTDASIQKAGADGKSIILVPIAFVSEHIETLVELDIEYAHLAAASGVKDYIRLPALGVNASYIKALNDEVLKAIGSGDRVVGDHNCGKCHSFCPKRGAA
ncbi:ferrochelatase [Asticcacaulis taihuensis]|jgi:ferrochelatase|uniref:Ferrochelatase n=1 Tax=Asticcacaulis taihuensis TaxID=260084 RepID=A0A1G4T2C2_9CAUL|nr:ferrochelatase [Asticcacaulis taihuensis]SCW74965.1 ferrochelatase [Asticcacaulis taihuensis]